MKRSTGSGNGRRTTAEPSRWRKQMPPQGWGAAGPVVCHDDTGRTLALLPATSDWRRPSLRQKLLSFFKRLWQPLNAQEEAMITAYRRCSDDTKKALLHLANEASKKAG